MLGEMVGADHGGHAPGDLAHRLEERQALVDLDGFVGDRRAAGPDERFGERAVRREMQVGEKNVLGTKPRHLLGLRLLHLRDEFGLPEYRLGIRQDLGPGRHVVRVAVA